MRPLFPQQKRCFYKKIVSKDQRLHVFKLGNFLYVQREAGENIKFKNMNIKHIGNVVFSGTYYNRLFLDQYLLIKHQLGHNALKSSTFPSPNQIAQKKSFFLLWVTTNIIKSWIKNAKRISEVNTLLVAKRLRWKNTSSELCCMKFSTFRHTLEVIPQLKERQFRSNCT